MGAKLTQKSCLMTIYFCVCVEPCAVVRQHVKSAVYDKTDSKELPMTKLTQKS